MKRTQKRKYWRSRADLLYYRAVFQVVCGIGADARSIIDVGSADTRYVSWFDWIDRKVQLNLAFPNKAGVPGVERIEADFLHWEPAETFDLALCLQVLEHVAEPRAFCEKLKRLASGLVVSVPYNWKAGKTKGHVHDPVDEQKLLNWMDIEPNYKLIVREPFGPARLIAYYDRVRGPGHDPLKEARRAMERRARARSRSKKSGVRS